MDSWCGQVSLNWIMFVCLFVCCHDTYITVLRHKRRGFGFEPLSLRSIWNLCLSLMQITCMPLKTARLTSLYYIQQKNYLSACVSVCVSVSPSMCQYVCLSVCLCPGVTVCHSVYLSIYLSISMSVYLSSSPSGSLYLGRRKWGRQRNVEGVESTRETILIFVYVCVAVCKCRKQFDFNFILNSADNNNNNNNDNIDNRNNNNIV